MLSKSHTPVLLLTFCSLILFFVTVWSPPALMDDVDAVTAQIARNMVESGDWVTPRLNGVAYFEKPALRFWTIAVSFLLFGVRDWAARIPNALAAVALCWLVRAMARRASASTEEDSATTWSWGDLAGIVMATCVGLFLFTRILIPDVILTLCVTLTLWSLARALEPDERRRHRHATIMAVSLGCGFLIKGLVAWVLPGGAALIWLIVTRQLFRGETWRALRPVTTALLLMLVCLPWMALATWRNPPWFDFTLHSQPGQYRGFFWFFVINEHVLRYLNLRYPRDYNTVPRPLFWLYHLLWLFPWSVCLPLVARLQFNATDRAGRLRLLCLCWIGFTLLFFSFSTTQEYYSMPCYPALALLIAAAMRRFHDRLRRPFFTAGAVAMLAAIACAAILYLTRGVNATGDIAGAMDFQISTLSLGKAGDLTLQSFAWLRAPLVIALFAFLLGTAGAWLRRGRYAVVALSLMMLLVFGAARMAMITLNPYLGSRVIAEALNHAPPGEWIADEQYYTWSSVFFYTNRRARLLNGRVMNLEYGANAPGAPDVFINDQDLARIWREQRRCYLTAELTEISRFEHLLGREHMFTVITSGGKMLVTNHETEDRSQKSEGRSQK
ncbi:MAG: ArnT family glycosyltransferase [Blastocatellia bacterium]